MRRVRGDGPVANIRPAVHNDCRIRFEDRPYAFDVLDRRGHPAVPLPDLCARFGHPESLRAEGAAASAQPEERTAHARKMGYGGGWSEYGPAGRLQSWEW